MDVAPSFADAAARRVLDAIDEHEVVDFLRRLVRLPTVNPPGDVRDAIRVCAEPLAGAGFDS